MVRSGGAVGALGVPAGTGGSGPHLGGCAGSVRGGLGLAAGGALCPLAALLGKGSASLPVPDSRRHLRQRVVHGRPGQPVGRGVNPGRGGGLW